LATTEPMHEVKKVEGTFLDTSIKYSNMLAYRGSDKSLARPTSHVLCLMVRIFRLMLVLLYIFLQL